MRMEIDLHSIYCYTFLIFDLSDSLQENGLELFSQEEALFLDNFAGRRSF